VQRAVRGALRAASITKHASCHTLRHSFATHLLAEFAGYCGRRRPFRLTNSFRRRAIFSVNASAARRDIQRENDAPADYTGLSNTSWTAWTIDG